jgi:hypothetical protein
MRGSAVLVIGVLVFLALWIPRAGMIHRTDPAMIATDVANRASLPVVLNAIRGNPAATVLITVPGPVYGGTLDFLARQQGVTRRFSTGYTWDAWEQFVEGVNGADVVVLSEAGMLGQSLGYAFPSVKFQERLLDALAKNPKFIGKRVYTDEARRSVWVFIRTSS